MGYFEQFPYTNFHELNLDWILQRMRDLSSEFNAFVESNIIKYADPIEWNIGTQYEANTIVRSGEKVYLSKQAVPSGVSITNEDYWFQVGDISTYSLELEQIKHQIASSDEGVNAFASQDYPSGSVFWLNGYLCRATEDIDTGAPFVNGSNYEYVTVLELIESAVSSMQPAISANTAAISTINNTTIPGLQTQIDTLAAEVVKNSFRNKAVLLVGDSFADGTGNDGVGWTSLFESRFGPSPCYKIHQNGGGLAAPGNTNADYPNMNYTQAITQYSTTLTAAQRSKVEWVIIQSGHNDVSTVRNPEGIAGVQAAMASLWPVLASNYPNARIAIIPTYSPNKTGQNDSLDGYRILHFTIPVTAILRGCISSTVSADWFYGDDNFAYGDGIHLNGNGYAYLAGYIAALCCGWNGETAFQVNRGVTKESGVTLSMSVTRRGTHVNMQGQLNAATYTPGATLFTIDPIYTGARAIYKPVMMYGANASYRGTAWMQITSTGAVNLRNIGTNNPPTTGLVVYFNLDWDVSTPTLAAI